MVKVIKGLSPHSTDGERRVFTRLKAIFSEKPYDNILLYYEPILGEFKPDFVLLSPDLGIIIIEVKDYSQDRLIQINEDGDWFKAEIPRLLLEKLSATFNSSHESVEIEFKINTVALKNPFEQLYTYRKLIQERVVHCKFPERLKIPIFQIVVFSQISKTHPTRSKLEDLCPKTISLLFKEDLVNSIRFYAAISDILEKPSVFAYSAPVKNTNGDDTNENDFNGLHLSEDLFKRLVFNLFPVSRLPTYNQPSLLEFIGDQERIKVLDIEQQKLAYSLGEGHRLIFGVAGSGKTVVLVARARYLALTHPDWNILILCYNRNLRKMLEVLLRPQDLPARITISTFHSWARDMILNESNNSDWDIYDVYKSALEKARKEDKLETFFSEAVPQILSTVIESMPEQDRGIYDAILIDEAQDFEEEWIRLIVKCLNPETQSLLICLDGLQGIYERKKFYWSDVGVKARGRVIKFRKSYRTPFEIATVAKKVIPKSLKDRIGVEDEFLEMEQFADYHGEIIIKNFRSRKEEYDYLCGVISDHLKDDKNLALLFLYNPEVKENGRNGGEFDHPLIRKLIDRKIPVCSVEKGYPNSPGVLIGTLYNTKGLEFNTVIIPEADKLFKKMRRQLLYVGLTRALKKAVITSIRDLPIGL